jgi:hypothetical protein
MDASETFVRMLESVVQTNTYMVEILLRMEQRQQEQTLALARGMAENTQQLAQMLERMDARIATDNRALAHILERVVDTTSRTEQMTAGILTTLSKGAAH